MIGAWYGAGVLIRKDLQGALFYVGGRASRWSCSCSSSPGSTGSARRPTIPGYAAHTGVSLFAVQLGWAFVVSLLALFGSAVYVAIELGRDGRRVRRAVI